MLRLTDATGGFPEILKVTDELLAKTPNSHMLCQFQNPANPNTHFRTTGELLLYFIYQFGTKARKCSELSTGNGVFEIVADRLTVCRAGDLEGDGREG